VAFDRDAEYLRWIDASVNRIREYTRGGAEWLLKQGPSWDAVLWRLETIGEATTRLSQELKQRHPEIAWRKIGDFRNIVAHGYRTLDPRVVQNIVDRDLGPLHEVVRGELKARRDRP
jgi:uncharacterized protein with HEPN domain